VAKFTLMCIILALAAIHNREVHQMDIKNAYLNAELTKTVYIAQPLGFIQVGKMSKVCKLFKALYGLNREAAAGTYEYVRPFPNSGTHGVKLNTACSIKRWTVASPW